MAKHKEGAVDMKIIFAILLAGIAGAVLWIYFTHISMCCIKNVFLALSCVLIAPHQATQSPGWFPCNYNVQCCGS